MLHVVAELAVAADWAAAAALVVVAALAALAADPVEFVVVAVEQLGFAVAAVAAVVAAGFAAPVAAAFGPVELAAAEPLQRIVPLVHWVDGVENLSAVAELADLERLPHY